MPAPSAKAMSVKLDQETRTRIERLAASRQRTPHWMMREAIHQYIDREEKRETFRQDAMKAWDDYQATGLHVTQAEAESWLSKLEAGQDAEPPPCHV